MHWKIVFSKYRNSISGIIGQINKNGQLFKNLSLAVKKKNPIFNIYGDDYKTFDGSCIRDYIHVCDLAEIHIKTLLKINLKNKSVILNCGYGNGFSVFEVVKEFSKLSKNKVTINVKERRRGDMTKIIARVNKLNKFLKFKPKFHSLKKMVKSSVDWEKKLNNFSINFIFFSSNIGEKFFIIFFLPNVNFLLLFFPFLIKLIISE